MTTGIYATTDHYEIRRWVETHDGQPASVRSNFAERGGGGLRIDFGGEEVEDELDHISWEEWFQMFEVNRLAFLYQERNGDDLNNAFFRLITR